MDKPTRRDWFRNASAAGLAAGVAGRTSPAGRRSRGAKPSACAFRLTQRVRENMHENYRREDMDRPDYKPWVVVLHTDDGLTGLGESTDDPRPHLAGMTGRSAHELLHNGAVGPGIMIAIYDLVAQAGGVPVCKLFAPEPRKTVQQTWWSHSLASGAHAVGSQARPRTRLHGPQDQGPPV